MVLDSFHVFSDVTKIYVMPESIKSFDPRKQLIRKDIQVHDNMLIVNMKWSKTRQFGHHRQIPIAAMPSNILCPVTAYKKMIRIADAGPLDPLSVLIRPVSVELYPFHTLFFREDFVI